MRKRKCKKVEKGILRRKVICENFRFPNITFPIGVRKMHNMNANDSFPICWKVQPNTKLSDFITESSRQTIVNQESQNLKWV